MKTDVIVVVWMYHVLYRIWIKFLFLKIDLDKSAIRVTVNVIRVTGDNTLNFFIRFIKELEHKHLFIWKHSGTTC